MQSVAKKRRNVIMATILVALMMVTAGWYYLSSQSSVISLDVNPSIAIQTNCFDQVVAVTAINEDAANLLATYDFEGKDLDTVIYEILDLLIANGYIDGATLNEILITGYEANDNEELKDEVSEMITTYLQEQQIDVSLYEQTLNVDVSGIKDYDYNHDYNYDYSYDGTISAGKMAVIDQIMTADPTLTLEDLATMSIKDLLALAEEQGTVLEGVTVYQNKQGGSENGNGPEQDTESEKNGEQNVQGPDSEDKQYMNEETNMEQNQNTVQTNNPDNNQSDENGDKVQTQDRVDKEESDEGLVPSTLLDWLVGLAG